MPRQRPRSHPPGLFIAWATLGKVSLASAGLVAAFLMLLAGFGWPLATPEFSRQSTGVADPDYVGSIPPSWQEDAARAHALLSRASVEVGLESQGNRDLVAFQLAQAIGPNLMVPDLSGQGLRFMRAQLLRSGDEPLAQLLYLGASGAPLALYAKKSEETSTPSFKRYGALGGVAWSQSGIAYLLAGEGDEASLTKLAEAIRVEMTAPAKAVPDYSPLPKPKPKPKP